MATDIPPELVSETPNTVTMVLQKKTPMQSSTIWYSVFGSVAGVLGGALAVIGEAAPDLLPLVVANPALHAALILAATVAHKMSRDSRKTVGDIQ